MDVFQFVSVNLELKDKRDLSFPFLDYGFLYGYGLFESIRIHRGKPIVLHEHFSRLQRGSIILDIPFDFAQSRLERAIDELVQNNNVTEAILNIYLTPGDRSEDPTKLVVKDPFLLMVLRPRPQYDPKKRHVLDCRQESFQRTPLDRFKTLSWMKNVLEYRMNEGVDDVLLYSQDGQVLETSRANAFFVKGDVIVTPKSPVILTGITRQILLERQDELGLHVLMEPIFLEYLETYDEMFITNALKGIILVDRVEGYPNLKSGPVSEMVQEKYFSMLGLNEVSSPESYGG